MKEPSTKLIGEVFDALKRLCSGELFEFRVSRSKGCVQIYTTKREKVNVFHKP